jgi:hypothetical protein
MIEQLNNQLLISFPTPEEAVTFAKVLELLFKMSVSQTPNQSATPDPASDVSSEQRSQHTVLTDDRLEALFNQRQQGQTAHQRVLRAQTTLRDGVLPFSKPGEMPAPSGQPSPRQKAAQEGTFADGEVVHRSKLRPAAGQGPAGGSKQPPGQ